jgi:hypothetical protein
MKGADEELDDGADEELDDDVVEDVVEAVGNDVVDEVVLSVVLEEVVVMAEVVVLDISTLVELAVPMQEHPLEILEDRPEHAVAHAGRVAEVVAVVYVEQNEVTAAKDRIITRCVY